MSDKMRGEVVMSVQVAQSLVKAYRKEEENLEKKRKPAQFFGLTFLVLLALLLWKIFQTPAYVLQYSEEAHEQIGMFVLFIGVAFVGVLVAAVPFNKSKKRSEKLKQEAIASLRSSLGSDASESDRVQVESLLRELGV